MKKIKKPRRLRHKAAAAAFALVSLSTFPAAARSAADLPLPEATIPALPDEEGDFQHIQEACSRNLAEAPFLMKEFLDRFPASAYRSEVTLMLADWYFFEKEYSLARETYSLIRDDAFSGDVRERMLYRKALSQIKSGYYSEARTYLRSLRNSSEFGDDARFYLAYIDYVNGKYDEAYSQFQKIQAAGPKGAEAEFYINQIDYLNGDYRKVANTSERLLSSGNVPDELKVQTMRVGGLSNFKLGSKAMARSMLANYKDIAGTGAEINAVYSLATIYYEEGDYDKALPLFTEVADHGSNLDQSASLYIGQIYLAQGDPRSAAMALDRAARDSWDMNIAETAAYNKAITSAMGESLPFSDSASALEEFIDSYPDSQYAPTFSRYLANAYYGQRNYEEALRQVDKIANPDASTRSMRQKILYQMGVSELQKGDLARAIKDLTEASSPQGPDREVAAQAALWLGDAYYAKKEYRDAVKSYKDAIASGLLKENTALANYNLGYAYMKLGDYKAATPAFKAAYPSDALTQGQQMDALLRYADCLYYTGKYQDALTAFRQVKPQAGPEGVYASIREADILGRNGKVDDKISILEGLYAMADTGIWRSTVVSRLADAYSEKGDDRKAAQLYAAMLDSGDAADNSEIYYALAANAENLYRSGDMEAALEAYRRLEKSGIDILYPSAVMGIMRSSADNDEIQTYAELVADLPGISAEDSDEARFKGASAALASGRNERSARSTLRSLSESSDRLWGARAAVVLAESLLKEGNYEEAENVLLSLIDNGSDDNYWLARGYIALADAYMAQDKDYLARLYLENLRDNYPGKEADIRNMISSRLKKLSK